MSDTGQKSPRPRGDTSSEAGSLPDNKEGGSRAGVSSTGQKLPILNEAAFERLADAIACAIYEEGCFAYFGGDVGMTYWCDLREEKKARHLEDARQLIRGALSG